MTSTNTDPAATADPMATAGPAANADPNTPLDAIPAPPNRQERKSR
jgi:hypothetical protein